MIEIKLTAKTIKIATTIDDMVKKFGWRIHKAITYENGKPYGLKSVEMVKLTRWWKFWNNDIKKAYKNYQGYLYVPWVIKLGKPEVYSNPDIDWNEMAKMLAVDPKYFGEINNISQLTIKKDEN
jgi:hypothetical protein